MNNPVILKVVEELETLPDNLQQQVLEYIQTLKASIQPGVPGRQLLRFAGLFPPNDLLLRKPSNLVFPAMEIPENLNSEVFTRDETSYYYRG